jgi:flagellar basal body rod protein FlgG
VEILNSINQAYSGLQLQQQRLDRNVAQIANVEAASGRDTRTQDRALVEQGEIVNSLRANAKSLQAAGERIGTLLDIKV